MFNFNSPDFYSNILAGISAVCFYIFLISGIKNMFAVLYKTDEEIEEDLKKNPIWKVIRMISFATIGLGILFIRNQYFIIN
jgi:hypothetical protein